MPREDELTWKLGLYKKYSSRYIYDEVRSCHAFNFIRSRQTRSHTFHLHFIHSSKSMEALKIIFISPHGNGLQLLLARLLSKCWSLLTRQDSICMRHFWCAISGVASETSVTHDGKHARHTANNVCLDFFNFETSQTSLLNFVPV